MSLLRSTPPLHVVGFVATRRGDPERGPLASLRTEEAVARLIEDGELVYLVGPRRKEMVEVRYDDAVPRGAVVIRDVSGVSVSEVIRLEKRPPPRAPT
ncbi:MAG: hypothetical protein IPK85_15045 [Gemmatimonadetes bacterium]|nr:hypothetical protein [Gemmatimonadota bacterium]